MKIRMECMFHINEMDTARYRPQRSCGQGYVFTRVCDSVYRGGSPGRENSPMGGRTPPGRETPQAGRTPPEQTPPRADTPLEQTPPRSRPPQSRHPPRSRPPGSRLPREVDCSIRSMRGRYASYWNAFLF